MAEKNYKMSPEVKKMIDKYAQKINHELSMEELENISGGMPSYFKQDGLWHIDFGDGWVMYLREYHDFLQDMIDKFGFDNTLEFIMLIDPDSNNIERMYTSGVDYYIGCIENRLNNYDGSLRSQ